MSDQKLAVANEILAQLGGNKFAVCTGIKNFAGSENSLSMKLARNKSKASHLVITLNSMDTYDLEFIQIRKFKRTVVLEQKGIYDDGLQSAFFVATGLYTSLGTMGR